MQRTEKRISELENGIIEISVEKQSKQTITTTTKTKTKIPRYISTRKVWEY